MGNPGKQGGPGQDHPAGELRTNTYKSKVSGILQLPYLEKQTLPPSTPLITQEKVPVPKLYSNRPNDVSGMQQLNPGATHVALKSSGLRELSGMQQLNPATQTHEKPTARRSTKEHETAPPNTMEHVSGNTQTISGSTDQSGIQQLNSPAILHSKSTSTQIRSEQANPLPTLTNQAVSTSHTTCGPRNMSGIQQLSPSEADNQKSTQAPPQSEVIKCLYTNADQFMNKRRELKTQLDDEVHRPLIIGITEVLPKNSRYAVDQIELQLTDYDLFTNIDNNTNGRGICLYIHSSLNATSYKFTQAVNFQEVVWASVQLGSKEKLIIGCMYRSPNSDNNNNAQLCQLFSSLNPTASNQMLLMGDFNFPKVNWVDCTCSCSIDSIEYSFLESTRDSFLTQMVHEPTRFRPGQEPNILDLIWTSDTSLVDDLQHKAPLGASDHCTLSWSILRKPVPHTSTSIKKLYDKGNYDRMKDMLNINWENELENLDVEASWEILKTKLSEAETECIPIKRVSKEKRRRPIWMNANTLRKIKKKHSAWNRYQRTKDGQDYIKFAKARNQAKWANRSRVREFEKQIARNMRENPKAFWNYINSKVKHKKGVPDLYGEDGQLTTNDKEKAEALGKFFQQVFTVEDLINPPTLENRDYDHPLNNIHITPESVRKKLSNLKVHKSPGPDGLHPRILKELESTLATPLAIIFNKMITSSSLPEDFKIGEIIPIHKKGNRHFTSNYRPVSLTSVACKVLESIFRDHIVKHMKSNLLFSKDQHGFLEGRSTITNLLEALEEWTKVLDEGGSIDVIYLDFMKAFDTVPHQKLLAKLLSYGITGSVHSWISAFLSNRKQRVVVNGEKSSWMDVTSGIPQGSVLGPILFVIFINDLPNNIQGSVKMFADDTKLYMPIRSPSDCHLLQQDLNSAEEWANKWQMRYHPDKCTVLRIGNNHPNFDYSMQEGQSPLQTSSQEKDLGVNVDDQLKFSYHIEKAVSRANSTLGLIRRSFEYLDEESLTLLYKAKVRPILEYGNAVWHPRLIKDLESVEAVQKRATRLVPGLTHLTYPECLKRLNLPTLVYRRNRGDMIQVFKYMSGRTDTKTSMFPKPPAQQTRGHIYKIHKQHCRLQVRHNFFSQRIVELWNNLPDSVVTATSLNAFKARLDKCWENKPFKFDYRS